MNAKEFIKKFGWGEAKSFVNKTIELYGCITTLHYASNGCISVLVPHLVRDFDVSISDLKRYVDAYELVQSYGGMSVINHKDFRLSMIISNPNKAKELNKAITLIEEI